MQKPFLQSWTFFLFGISAWSLVGSVLAQELDEIDAYLKNAASIETIGCLMEVELVEDTADLSNVKYRNHRFLYCSDSSLGKRRYDFVPEFDSTSPNNIVEGSMVYFVDSKDKSITVNMGGLTPPMKLDFKQAELSESKVYFASPFLANLTGYSGFTPKSISRLVGDDLKIYFDGFTFENRESNRDGSMIEYRVSKKLPVFTTFFCDERVGGMPVRTRTSIRSPDGKKNDLGSSSIEWKKFNKVWVPISQQSESISSGGGPTKGGYSLKCDVKFTWITKLPDGIWNTGKSRLDFLVSQSLVEYILENARR